MISLGYLVNDDGGDDGDDDDNVQLSLIHI